MLNATNYSSDPLVRTYTWPDYQVANAGLMKFDLSVLPAGALVFFSDKHRRYVHPTAGTLLDPHPRLERLSDAESQELEAQWQEALARA